MTAEHSIVFHNRELFFDIFILDDNILESWQVNESQGI